MKARWGLVMHGPLGRAVAAAVEALTIGADKHGDHGTLNIPDALRKRRLSAGRHWDAIMRGEERDVDGATHAGCYLANHIIITALIILRPELVEEERVRGKDRHRRLPRHLLSG